MAEDGDRDSEAGTPRIAWETAEVEDGELHVALAGDVPKAWRKRFSAVLAQLDAAGEQQWGAVKVAKGRIVVRDVAEGAEADLRHQLESALLQANADLAADDGEEQTQGQEQDPQQQRDGRMTAAFREFAD
jgi:hypothetical protein